MVALLTIGSPASADLNPARFCVVPVEMPSGITTEPWRISTDSFSIPGLSAPIFVPSTLPGKWTIGADHKLIAYTEPFPNSYLDQWAIEPWSQRVVATEWGSGVSVLNPGATHFTAINPADAPFQFSFAGPFVLPSRRQTMVASNGQAFVVEQDSLRTWMSKDDLVRAGLDGISSIHDAPSLGGLVVLTRDKRIFVLAGEHWQRVASLEDDDYGHLIDLQAISTAVFMANRSVIAIRRPRPDEDKFIVERLATEPDYGASFSFHRSDIFGQLLHYGRGGLFDRAYRWQRLTAEGLEEIPGGHIGLPVGHRDNRDIIGVVKESRVLQAAVIAADDGLHLYDGQRIQPVENTDPVSLGPHVGIFDLPSIGHTLITSQKGLFEISRSGGLTAVKAPFPVGERWPATRFIDWPEAGVALAVSSSGIFAVDAHLDIIRIPGGDAVTTVLFNPVETMAARGAKVLADSKGIFLAVDTRYAGPSACSGTTQN